MVVKKKFVLKVNLGQYYNQNKIKISHIFRFIIHLQPCISIHFINDKNIQQHNIFHKN